MPLLNIQDLAYHTANREPILNGLSLTIYESEIHALLGTNGTGKSTLAYIIMGCDGYTPFRGSIIFRGELINALSLYERARRGITLAWQEPVRFEGISVRSYLSLGRDYLSPSKSLEMAGLPPEQYLSRMVDRSLSGGERKRIELASVLSLQPALAILDEPDSGIDMLSTDDIVHVIKALKNNGSSVLLITHREEIALIADRASQLCMGKIIYTGSPSEVATFYKTKQCLTCRRESCNDE